MLYVDHREAFEAYCLAYATDRKRFLLTWRDELEEMGDDPSTLELLYAFGERAGLLLNVDWRGEENVGEIDEFVEMRTDRSILWERTDALRGSVPEEEQRDGRFIRRLLGTINEDLRMQGWSLVLFALPWDAYVLMPVEERVHTALMEKASEYFSSIGEL